MIERGRAFRRNRMAKELEEKRYHQRVVDNKKRKKDFSIDDIEDDELDELEEQYPGLRTQIK